MTMKHALLAIVGIFALVGVVNIIANFFGYAYTPLGFWKAVIR